MERIYEKKNSFYIDISWSPELDSWEMHTDTLNSNKTWSWSPQEFKKLKEGLAIAKERLKEKGIKKVIGLCETKKEKKFNVMFGFKEVPSGIVLTEDGILYYLLEMEI